MGEISLTLEERVAVHLVWALPKNTTITIGQVKEIAPVVASFIERLGMDNSSANSYESIKEHIKKTYPAIYKEASAECHNDNCQSMPVILITAIDKLANGAAIEKDEA